jgi:hypothetical protein
LAPRTHLVDPTCLTGTWIMDAVADSEPPTVTVVGTWRCPSPSASAPGSG